MANNSNNQDIIRALREQNDAMMARGAAANARTRDIVVKTGQEAAKKVTRHTDEAHVRTRDIVVKTGQAATSKITRHTDEAHVRTRDVIVRTGQEAAANVNRHTDEAADRIIRHCGSNRMAPWMVVVSVLVGVLFAVATGFLCWDTIHQYLCWTIDSVGNTVQVANYSVAVKYAYLLDGIIAVAVGALAGWATSSICGYFGDR